MEIQERYEHQRTTATPQDVQTVLSQLTPGTIAYFVLKLFERKPLLPEEEVVRNLKAYLETTDQSSGIATVRRNTNDRISRYGLQIRICTSTSGKKVWGVFPKENLQNAQTSLGQTEIERILNTLAEEIRTRAGLEDTPAARRIIMKEIANNLRRRIVQARVDHSQLS
jgi:hypothetical protein